MTIRTLERSPDIWAHDHRGNELAFWGGADPAYNFSSSGVLERLRPVDELRPVIRQSGASVVALHAISEAQRATELLAMAEDVRIIWIYRRYADVANSAVKLWGDHQVDVIRRIRDDEWDFLKWRGEGVSEAEAERLAALYRDDLTPQEGGALFWYLRNHHFFAQELEHDNRVLLIKYEDVVSEPERHFGRVFEFLGVPFEPSLVDHIFTSSVGKERRPAFDPEIEALCRGLYDRFEAAYHAQSTPA